MCIRDRYKDVTADIDRNTTGAKNRAADSISFSDVDVTEVVQTGEKTFKAVSYTHLGDDHTIILPSCFLDFFVNIQHVVGCDMGARDIKKIENG